MTDSDTVETAGEGEGENEYEVEAGVFVSGTMTVKADSEEEARERARFYVQDCDLFGTLGFSLGEPRTNSVRLKSD